MTSTPNDGPTPRHRVDPGMAPPTPAETSGSSPAPMPEAEYRARNESLGEMFSSFADHISTLFRQELTLAKAEATDSAKKAGAGAGMLAGAAVGGFFVLMFLSLALAWALGNVMDMGWAALIVAAIWAVITAVLALVGKQRLEKIKGLPRTQETVQEVPATLNPSKETP
ncbi:phage holin family protein [Corynebacterium halotolerans]|uniref:phage holin family protein n=1 Tax=Corynebacterium halotolerans TaxID=225326 RepID=UPI003CF8FF12